MQPRSSTAKKWTALPAELRQQMKTVLTDSFKAQVGRGEVTVDGRIYPDEILILVGVVQPKSLKAVGWEISIGYRVPKDNVLKLLHLGMDAAGALFEQLFSAEDDSEFPVLWQKVDFEKREIYVQYTTVNPVLESEADRLLGAAGDEALVNGDWEDDLDPATLKAQLGIDPDDEGDQ